MRSFLAQVDDDPVILLKDKIMKHYEEMLDRFEKLKQKNDHSNEYKELEISINEIKKITDTTNSANIKLKLFENFLGLRWFRIKNTEMSYENFPHSSITQYCQAIASLLTVNQHDIVEKQTANHFLMPQYMEEYDRDKMIQLLRSASCMAVLGAPTRTEDSKLAVASYEGNMSIVQALLVNKYPLNYITRGGYTALGLAILRRHFLIAQLLIKHGADINMGIGAERTPLSVAIKEKHLETIILLLNKNVIMSEQEKAAVKSLLEEEKTQLLEIVIKSNDTERAQQLIAEGVVISNEALHACATSEMLNIIKKAVNLQNAETLRQLLIANDILQHAIIQSRIFMVDFCINAGANIDDGRITFPSPLARAALQDNMLALKLLLLNTKDDEITTANQKKLAALYFAIFIGNIHGALAIIESGLDINGALVDFHGNIKSPGYLLLVAINRLRDNKSTVAFIEKLLSLKASIDEAPKAAQGLIDTIFQCADNGNEKNRVMSCLSVLNLLIIHGFQWAKDPLISHDNVQRLLMIAINNQSESMHFSELIAKLREIHSNQADDAQMMDVMQVNHSSVIDENSSTTKKTRQLSIPMFCLFTNESSKKTDEMELDDTMKVSSAIDRIMR